MAVMLTKFLLSVVLLVSGIRSVTPYCYTNVVDGDFCTGPNGVSIPSGGDLVIPEKCESCTCLPSFQGKHSLILSCCGYGIHGGVVAPPPGCKMVPGEDGCSMQFVMIADETQNCSLSLG